ncbi:MAG: CGNR zinc finger domain-containing protein [Chloroflexi bacterium]|nr:CGNR zinc finger domain-containing protein [Chloroflexota bacterium]
MSEERPRSRFLFRGGHPSLDFVNTVSTRDGDLVDRLVGFDDLLTWLVEADLLDARKAAEAKRRWAESETATRVVAEARALRAAVRELADSLTSTREASAESLVTLNRCLQQRVGYPQVVRVAGRYQRRIQAEYAEGVQLLGPVAEAALALLVDLAPTLVKRCGNPACVLFFYDTTKNHRRRWCSMATCGNRSKAAAHRQRRSQRPRDVAHAP